MRGLEAVVDFYVVSEQLAGKLLDLTVGVLAPEGTRGKAILFAIDHGDVGVTLAIGLGVVVAGYGDFLHALLYHVRGGSQEVSQNSGELFGFVKIVLPDIKSNIFRELGLECFECVLHAVGYHEISKEQILSRFSFGKFSS